MPSLEQVKKQLSHISGIESLFGRKEIKELPSILWDDESVEGMITGQYHNGMGALFVTNKRLIFVDKGFMFGLRVEDFPLDKVSSIQYETGLLMGKITIFTSGNKAVIDATDKALTRTFSEIARAKIENLKVKKDEVESPKMTINQKNISMEEKINQLERLQKLREAGILSDEELAAQKDIILND